MNPSVETHFRATIRNPRTLERMLKANAGIVEGELIRGRHRANEVWKWRATASGFLPKRKFIERFGREVWDMIPRHAKMRDGRREAAPFQLGLSMEAVPPAMRGKAAELLRLEYASAKGDRVFTLAMKLAWDAVWGFGLSSASAVTRGDLAALAGELQADPASLHCTIEEFVEPILAEEDMISPGLPVEFADAAPAADWALV